MATILTLLLFRFLWCFHVTSFWYSMFTKVLGFCGNNKFFFRERRETKRQTRLPCQIVICILSWLYTLLSTRTNSNECKVQKGNCHIERTKRNVWPKQISISDVRKANTHDWCKATVLLLQGKFIIYYGQQLLGSKQNFYLLKQPTQRVSIYCNNKI